MNDAQRGFARLVFDAGVRAADPAGAVRDTLRAEQPIQSPSLILAVGKAAHAMCSAALECCDNSPEAIVVTNPENARGLAGALVLATGHPVPNEAGEAAGRVVMEALSKQGEGDLVLALISGGGSALLPAPVDGISLADKAAVNEVLLGSGAPIEEMNLVRQRLSRLKGGGMTRIAAPARIIALVLSDVIGDDLRAIASGPTCEPLGSDADAVNLLRSYGIWNEMPGIVQEYLETSRNELPPEAAENFLIGSNGKSVMAMAAHAPDARVIETPLVGDVVDAAQLVVTTCSAPGTYLMGGETTVVLTGTGRGGRNQDMALRVALVAENAGGQGSWTSLQGGTDGRDGPTDAAGGIVDQGSLARIRAAGLDPAELLANNDSYRALEASGDLLMTGGTGTNVADLGVLIRG
jgi:hydroxypyruvate reductase